MILLYNVLCSVSVPDLPPRYIVLFTLYVSNLLPGARRSHEERNETLHPFSPEEEGKKKKIPLCIPNQYESSTSGTWSDCG